MTDRDLSEEWARSQLEAWADGICDCLLAHVYERRFHPEEKIHQPWLDKQWSKVERALDHLVKETLKLPKKTTGGHIALRACLGYALWVGVGSLVVRLWHRSISRRAWRASSRQPRACEP